MLYIDNLSPSSGAVEYTDCIFAEGWDTHHHQVSWYDTKQSDGEDPVLEFLFIAIAPIPLWPGVVAPGRAKSMSQIELFDI